MKAIKQATTTLQIIIKSLGWGLGNFLFLLFTLKVGQKRKVEQFNSILIIFTIVSVLIFLIALYIQFKGLSKVTDIIWDDLSIILKSKNNEIKIYTNNIVGIKQHYQYVGRGKEVIYYDYYTLYMHPNMEKINLDLTYFPQRKILLDEINLRLTP